MRKILITGVTGTIGSGLLHKLSNFNNIKIIGVDSNNKKIKKMTQKYLNFKNIHLNSLSINNFNKLNKICNGINLIYHAAAVKDVILAEENPDKTIKTNLEGIQNLIKCSISNNVNKVIFCSSDKAVNPTNVMGASKLIGERLFIMANHISNKSKTKFSCVRFGNVLGSSGSFLPIFYKQIQNSQKLTITHKKMTRFIMSKDQAIKLLIKSANISKGGEIFVLKMDSVKIDDVASVLNKLYRNNKKNYKEYIGIRSGEKLYEELIGMQELNRTKEFKNYFIIYSNHKNKIKTKEIKKEKINSDIGKFLSKKQIENIIKKTYPLI